MNSTTDGDYQTFKANDGAYVREHFFGRDPRTAAMVKDWSDEQIWALTRGGHDFHKVYAAYKAATEFAGAPTVILAHTIKGYFLGQHFAGRNATHQMKKMALDDLKAFRDRVQVPVSDEVLESDPYRPPYVRLLMTIHGCSTCRSVAVSRWLRAGAPRRPQVHFAPR